MQMKLNQRGALHALQGTLKWANQVGECLDCSMYHIGEKYNSCTLWRDQLMQLLTFLPQT